MAKDLKLTIGSRYVRTHDTVRRLELTNPGVVYRPFGVLCHLYSLTITFKLCTSQDWTQNIYVEHRPCMGSSHDGKSVHDGT